MTVVISGDTGISPVTATGTSALIDGMTVGRGAGEVSTNTAVGYQALQSNTTAGSSTAIGYQALYSNTGAQNTVVGTQAAYTNSTGVNNVVMGNYALYYNTSGSYNTVLGHTALNANTTASYNTAVGYQAAYLNTTGAQLTVVGHQALYNNTTGVNNSAFGRYALSSNTTGANNVGVGVEALNLNTTASNNTAVGYQAGYSNTTATRVTALGMQAGYSGTSGANYSTYVGYQAGYATTGQGNVFIGDSAGASVTTGSANTFIGANNAVTGAAGQSVTTGSKNTIIGAYTGNQGGLDIRTASNYIVLSDGDGNPKAWWDNNYNCKIRMGSGAGTNALRYNTSSYEVSYDTSSARYKDNIRDSVYGLSHVMQMRSAQFEYKDGGRTDIGLIAEEVVSVIPELVGTDAEGRPDSVTYDRMVSVLVKAIQELNAQQVALKAEFDAYKTTHP